MKRIARKSLTTLVGMLALVAGWVPTAAAQTASADLTKQIGIEQRLGNPVPKDVRLKAEDGRDIVFGDLLGGRPVLVVPVFYTCSTGCAVITESLLKTLVKGAKAENLVVGRDLDVAFVSLHPKETPELALKKKNIAVDRYNEPGSEGSWHFLTGEQSEVKRLMDALGFRYSYNPATNQLNHALGVIFVSPNGIVSSYVMGAQFPTKVLIEDAQVAARNEVGQKAETFLFGCVMMDPATGQRRIVIENVVRLAGVVTLLVLIASITMMSLGARKRSQTGAH